MAAKRYPLPKRFNVAVSERAYENLRGLNEKYHYGNNYLLTILLENLDRITDGKALEKVFDEFKKEYGAPTGGK
jgi:DTW domain-containing protein YfiP